MGDAVGQRVSYLRVSTLDQSIDRQLNQVAVDRHCTDQVSGKDTQRSQLAALPASRTS